MLVEAEGLQRAVLFLVVEEERGHGVDVGLVGEVERVVVEQRHGEVVALFEDSDVVALLHGDPDVEAVVGGSVDGLEQWQCEVAGVAVFFDQGEQDWAVGRELLFLAVGVEEGEFGRWVHERSLALTLWLVRAKLSSE